MVAVTLAGFRFRKTKTTTMTSTTTTAPPAVEPAIAATTGSEIADAAVVCELVTSIVTGSRLLVFEVDVVLSVLSDDVIFVVCGLADVLVGSFVVAFVVSGLVDALAVSFLVTFVVAGLADALVGSGFFEVVTGLTGALVVLDTHRSGMVSE